MPPTSVVATATGGDKDNDRSSASTPEPGSQDGGSRSRADSLATQGPSPTTIGLICVSGESEFDVIRAWGENVIQASCCFLFRTAVH